MGLLKWWTDLLDKYVSSMMTVMGIILLFSLTVMPILEVDTWRYYAHFFMGLACLWMGTWDTKREVIDNESF